MINLQLIFDAGCSPILYHAQGKKFDFPDMTVVLCPQCKKDFLKKHGFYSRYLITFGFAAMIIIRRYYCKCCKKTVSLLPSFCHPKRAYGIEAIIMLLKEFYDVSLCVSLAVINFYAQTEIECSRQLLLHYRRRIEKNLKSLIMAITSIYSFKEPPVTEKTDIKKRVRQFLSHIHRPKDDSLKIFEQTRTTYLTPYPI